MKNGIWWLASYPKSGNTWARMVLNAAITGFPPDINSAWQYVTSDRGGSLYGCTSAVPTDKMDDRDVISYRLAALRNQLEMFCRRDVCLKTHHGCYVVHEVPLIPGWLTKGAVYLVRDPRDVVISLAKHLGKSIDDAIDFMNHEQAGIVTDGTKWKHFLSTWTLHINSWLDEENPLQAGCVRYEDMLKEPSKAFRKLFDCLGLSHITQERIDWAIEQCRIHKLQAQENKRGFVERSGKTDRFFGNGQAGGWRETLSPQQVERIETDHGAIMQDLGYTLSLSSVGV